MNGLHTELTGTDAVLVSFVVLLALLFLFALTGWVMYFRLSSTNERLSKVERDVENIKRMGKILKFNSHEPEETRRRAS